MKNKPEKHGMTLVEMLLAVVILLVLVTLTATIGRRIELQSQEKLTTETINIIVSALSEFTDFDYDYKDEDYRALKFPVDCNDWDNSDVSNIESILRDALGRSSGVSLQRYTNGNYVQLTNTFHPDEYSGCEMMYFWLRMVPSSRAILDNIDQSLITNDCGSGSMNVDIDGQKYPWMRIEDAWGTVLHYSYYYNGFEDEHSEEELREPDYYHSGQMDGETRPFPVITSAGRDKVFGTDDDITSR